MENIFTFIDKNQEKYINWLTELCRIPSEKGNEKALLEAATYVKQMLENIGVEAELVETSGLPVVYGELNYNKEKTLTFYNHYDVQPSGNKDLWSSDPYGGNIINGKLISRGAGDNKGNLVARLAAVDAYLNYYDELPVNLKFIFEGEEESGSVHLEEFVTQHPEKVKSDGCIWEAGYRDSDGSLHLYLGLKGLCFLELSAEGANTDLHSSRAAIIENPAWRLTWALNSLKDQSENIKIEGFYDSVKSLSEDEKKHIHNINFEEKETLNNLELKSYINNVSGDTLKERLIAEPTCNICGLKSGVVGDAAMTVLPKTASAKLDFRLVPNQDPEEVVKQLRSHLDKNGFEDIKINASRGRMPARTSVDDPLVEACINSATEVFEKPPIVYLSMPASGPMYELCQQNGVPSVSLGIGNPNTNVHAPDENVLISDFVNGIKMAANIVKHFGK